MNFPAYRESYIQRLESLRREREEERRNAPKTPTLAEQITEWHNSVSPTEQRAAYSMEWFKERFGGTSQKLGITLFGLGWRRLRRWETGKPHCRVWVKCSSDK